MKGLFKKTVAGITVLTMVAAMGITALAHSEMDNMVFAGYDTTDPYNPNKIYNEIINGKYTNKQVLVPVTPIWSAEGYEGVYPYAGYNRMYLEGKAQSITVYNNLFPQWETRRKDYMWEIKAPYAIWERQQTKVDNKTWTWDFGNAAFNIPDEALKTKTNRNAKVLAIGMEKYGFGVYNNEGAALGYDELRMYNDFNLDAAAKWADAVANKLTVEKLSERDAETGRYIVTDEEIASYIPVVYTKYVTAKFNDKNNDGLQTKVVAEEYLKHMDEGWEWDYDSFGIAYDAEIEWTAPAFEMNAPYNYYQYLVINDIVFDGKDGKEVILRYTGGKASPKVEWKFVFFQHILDEFGNEIPQMYEAVQRKYVDGVAAVDEFGNPVYRVPELGDGNGYFKMNGNMIEYWGASLDNKTHTVLARFENWTGNLGGIIDGFVTGSINTEAVISAEAYKELP